MNSRPMRDGKIRQLDLLGGTPLPKVFGWGGKRPGAGRPRTKTRLCARCGEVFRLKRQDARFCSPKCRVAARRAAPDRVPSRADPLSTKGRLNALHDAAANIAISLRQLDQALARYGAGIAKHNEILDALLRRITAIERHLSLVEPPRPPRSTRARPRES
jgi:hypothetical protein